ncbi:hypothetical protein [Pleomorphomonas sp. JP5]|uniref:hypothetical protein n=1 Tax=Pleomorphomonas sp. JP5 TaxID=2942998 RepID=UPI0020447CD4|nr:hypothetical protein [Pleomorphomonas sp. JP5]MCM5556378.1 hypothetical protein [Pleomorphomonas sp. JP5]
MHRIAGLRRQLKQIEELRLARVMHEEAEIDEKCTALITALNDDSPLHGLFAGHMAGRLKRLTERRMLLEPLKAQQIAAVMTEARHTRFAETMIDRLECDVAAEDEKQQLESLVEGALARRRHASLA